jgi:hypothetical protein
VLHEVVVSATMTAVREAVGSMINAKATPIFIDPRNDSPISKNQHHKLQPHSVDESPYLNQGVQSNSSHERSRSDSPSFSEFDSNKTKTGNNQILLFPRHFQILFV